MQQCSNLTMYSIITTPNSILVHPSEPIKSFNKKLKGVISEMEETLLRTSDPKGVGLAAPQVGLPLRIFLARPTDKSKTTVYINPVIQFKEDKPETEKKPKRKRRLLEGCLSIPNIWGNVTRKKELTLTWQDENGRSHTKDFRGFIAIIIQHEVDHLNGILFTTHVMAQREKLYKSHKNERGEDEFDEVKI